MNGIEIYKNALIAYALPDLIRPVPFADDEITAAMARAQYDSFVLKISVSGDNRTEWEIFPCILDASLQTKPANEEESKLIKSHLNAISKDITAGVSSAKHYDFAGKDFGNIYIRTLMKAFRRGGLRWLIQRIATLKPYHITLVLRGISSVLKRSAKRS
jgi:hypothetical protein